MKNKIWSVWTAGLLIITSVILSACGSPNYENSAADNSLYTIYPQAAPMTEAAIVYDDIGEVVYGDYNELNAIAGGFSDATIESNVIGITPEMPVVNNDFAFRKLIKDANITVETEEFDFLLKDIENRVTVLGGYMENFHSSNNSRYGYNVQNRYASMTIRIPAVQYENFISMVGEISNVLNRNESVRDVTLQYVDSESRKEALEVEYERLMELLARAETIESIIMLEQRLTNVRYQIEGLGSQLRTYDNLVSYSTIYLQIQEVTELTPVVELSFGEKISTGFRNSLKSIGRGLTNFFVWLIVSSPFLVIWAIIIGIGVLVIRVIVKKNKLKNANRVYKIPNTYAQSEKIQNTESVQNNENTEQKTNGS